jgi:hypothetical protein
MIVSRIKLKNWRNFQKVDVPLRERMFIVGPNASGKSNFLDVFRFLRDIAKSEGGGLQKAVRDRGGISKLRCLLARRDPQIEIEVHLPGNFVCQFENSCSGAGVEAETQPVQFIEQGGNGIDQIRTFGVQQNAERASQPNTQRLRPAPGHCIIYYNHCIRSFERQRQDRCLSRPQIDSQRQCRNAVRLLHRDPVPEQWLRHIDTLCFTHSELVDDGLWNHHPLDQQAQ